MRLLDEIKVGKSSLKNRIMFAPLTTGYEGKDGSITPESTAFYSRLAQGGTGYIVVGDVNPIRSFSPTPRLNDDAQIPSFKALADEVHKYGAKIAAQIFHPEYNVQALAQLFAQGKMQEVREKLHYDMLHVAQGNHTGNLADTIPPMGIQPYAFFVDITGEIKKEVSIPVSAVGRIIDPAMANRIIDSGKADIIGLGRPLLADPDWVIKIENNKIDEIRRCMSCNKCTDSIQNRKAITCVINAQSNFMEDRAIIKPNSKKKVVVVGGGFAGMEAARVSALKGHDVVLFEKGAKLGGQVNIASVPPRKQEMKRAIDDLSASIHKNNVVLKMGVECDSNMAMSENPDAVIVAVGANSFYPKIKGYDLSNVKDAWEVLAGEDIVYGDIVVIGGGLVGTETTEYLASRGNKVKIVEMLDKIAEGESTTILPTVLENYKNYGVETYTGTKVEEITIDSVKCVNKEGVELSIPCDYVVMAIGAKKVQFDSSALIEKGIEVHFVGDGGEQIGDIGNAINSAYLAANSIN